MRVFATMLVLGASRPIKGWETVCKMDQSIVAFKTGLVVFLIDIAFTLHGEIYLSGKFVL